MDAFFNEAGDPNGGDVEHLISILGRPLHSHRELAEQNGAIRA